MKDILRSVDASKALNSKYPEQVVAVTSVDSEGNPNAIILGWSMITSGDPRMLAISVGHRRYSNALLKECGEFVLAFPAMEAEEEMLFCGTESGRDYENKLAECGWETQEADLVSPPLLTKCVANFECRITDHMETGDHTLFVGEIVAAHLSENYTQRLYNFGSGVFDAAIRPNY